MQNNFILKDANKAVFWSFKQALSYIKSQQKRYFVCENFKNLDRPEKRHQFFEHAGKYLILENNLNYNTTVLGFYVGPSPALQWDKVGSQQTKL